MDLTGLNSPNGMGDISIKAASGGNAFQDVLSDSGADLTASAFGDDSAQSDTTTGSGSAEGNQIRLQAEGMRDEADALRDQAAALREEAAGQTDHNAAGRINNQALALENRANALDLEADQTDIRADNADQRSGASYTASAVSTSVWDDPDVEMEFETAISEVEGFEGITVSATRQANDDEVYSLLEVATSMGATGADLVDVQAYADIFPVQFVFVDNLIEDFGAEVASGGDLAVLDTSTIVLDSVFKDIDFAVVEADEDPTIAAAGQEAVEYAMADILGVFDFVSNSDLLESLSAQISGLGTAVDGVGTAVGDVDAAVGDVGVAVADVGAAVGDVGAAVGDVGFTVDGVDATVTSTNETVNGIDVKLDNVGATVSNTDGTVTDIDATLDGVGATVASTDGTVNNIDAKLNDVGATVNNTDATVSNVDAKLDGVGATVTSTDATVNLVDAKLDGVGATVNSTETTVNSVDAKLDGVDTALTNLAAEPSTTVPAVEEAPAPVEPSWMTQGFDFLNAS